ncbi:MAG: RecX family transcriptional regulator [Anaerolineae bacterium]|nr:RecX family transcriptional regulator [Anaerolineae bacterium]
MAGTITAFVLQKHNKERVNVYLDGEFAFGLALVEAGQLHKGQYLSDADIEALHSQDQMERVYQRALNYLKPRPRSAEEIRRNLREHDAPQTAIDAALARLARVGLVDDAAFARYWIDNRQRFKPRSPHALRYELRQKGVADDVIDAALVEVDAAALAYHAARRYQRRLAHTDPETFRRKLGDHLARRGFAYPLIREVVDRLSAERAGADH